MTLKIAVISLVIAVLDGTFWLLVTRHRARMVKVEVDKLRSALCAVQGQSSAGSDLSPISGSLDAIERIIGTRR